MKEQLGLDMIISHIKQCGVLILLLTVGSNIMIAQSSMGFTTKNYALEPAKSPQVLHIPITAIDVSYGLNYSKKEVFKDFGLNVYTGIYLAQQGFGGYFGLGTASQLSSGRTGRRHFVDVGIALSKPVFCKKQVSIRAFVEPQLLIALEDATFSRTYDTINQLSFYRTYEIQVSKDYIFTWKRNPVNLFMNYGLSVDYQIKWLPLVFSSSLSLRDFIGDYFTKIDFLTTSRLQGPTVDDARVDIHQIQSSGNALGYSFSVRYAF